MSQYHMDLHGHWLYYDAEQYETDRDVFDYLGTLDQSEIKTLFDAAYVDGAGEFQTVYGTDYQIVYDYSTKAYTLKKR
ncbi:MAG: hypothetical protein U1A25_00325 [Candidatus Sungbacteria bacterium]|nr:hypothetical protein [bacterium]MDZ4260089.1 hypothetical protein [Candidatus Sungbacteria bacterium]